MCAELVPSIPNLKLQRSWLSDYELTEFLGSGSYGGVYKATHKTTKAQSAVKITYLQKHFITVEQDADKINAIRKKMRREYSLLLGKRHKNIVNADEELEVQIGLQEIESILLNVKTTSAAKLVKANFEYWAETSGLDALFIRMELCESTLCNWIENFKEKGFELSFAHMNIIQGLIEGVKFIHENKILHRDIKSDNIFFAIGENKYNVKIGDFGIGRLIHSAASKTSAQTAKPMTTPLYKAPELETDEYSLQADLFSLGLLFVEVLQMVKAIDRALVFKRIRDRTGGLNLPNEPFVGVSDVVLKLTEEDPKDRLKSVRSLRLNISDGFREQLYLLKDLAIVEEQIQPDENSSDLQTLSPAANSSRTWVSRTNRLVLAGTSSLRSALQTLRPPSPAVSLEQYSGSMLHGLKNLSRTFIGRDLELNQLNDFYESNAALSVVVVSGLGGVGKTELIIAFAWSKVKKNNVNVVWLNGDSEDILKECVNNFINFGTSGKQTVSREKLLEGFNSHLRKQLGKWIIVFDNVDDVNPLVDSIIDKLQSKGTLGFFRILITSRNATCVDYVNHGIALDKFCREDSIKLVAASLKHYPGENKSDGIIALCDALEDFPLALQQAVAYIKLQKRQSIEGESYSIAKYLEEFRNHSDMVLGKKIHVYGYTTLNTVKITIDKLSKEGEIGLLGIEILNLLAFVNSDDLRFQFLKVIYKLYSDSEVEIESAVKRIKAYSMIKAVDNMISSHRLVQTVVMLQMQHEIFENALHRLVKVLRKVSCNEVQDVDIEHIRSMWALLLRSTLDRKQLCLIPQNFSEILLQHSYYDAALIVCNDSLCKFSEEFEENITHKLKIKFNSARCYNYKEDHKSAIKILDEIYNVVKENFENDYDFLVAVLLETASVQQGLQNFHQAGNIYAKAHTLAKESLGDKHVRTMTAKHGLGIVLLERKKYFESYIYLNEVYQWRIFNLGQSHPSTYRTQYYLGRCLLESGEPGKSKEILETALVNEKLYHDGHKHTMLILETIVEVYVALKENGKAVNIQIRICDICDRTLGPNRDQTRAAKTKLDQLRCVDW